MDEITTRADYLSHFSDEIPNNKSKQQEALKQALDIRKFEIDLYWKRTTYFWTIIAAIFAGFFVLQKSSYPSPGGDFGPSFIVSNLGFVFSLGWYFVNRGSKVWQQNWEKHVDLLEDEVMGPLYKTVKNSSTYKFFDLTEAYPFSLSIINQLLSLFVAAIWLFLVLRSVAFLNWNVRSDLITFGVISPLTLWIVYQFFKKGITTKTDDDLN